MPTPTDDKEETIPRSNRWLEAYGVEWAEWGGKEASFQTAFSRKEIRNPRVDDCITEPLIAQAPGAAFRPLSGQNIPTSG